ncbi:MAG TPA: glycosyltransferase family 39 protein [Thermoanaerobaculia bacterium]|nr:glycosyltransferase family 39 protein [Thermoanaerobaculia bacterium]
MRTVGWRRHATAAAWLATAFAIGVHALLFWIEQSPEPRQLLGDESTYLQAALRVRAGEPAGLEPLRPPLYPYFLALLLGPGGDRRGVEVAQVILLAGVAWLVGDIWRRLGPAPALSPVLAAAVLGVPALAAFAHYLWPEILHLFFVVAALWILAARRQSTLWAAAYGVLLALATLTKLLLAPLLPALLLPLALSPGRRVLRPVVAAAAILLVLAPAALRNRRSYGVAVVADSSRFNLWIGLNDRARTSFGDSVIEREFPIYLQSAPTFRERQEILDRKIRDFVRSAGWIRILRQQLGRQYFRLLDKDNFLIEQLPGGRLAERGAGYRRPNPAAASALRIASHATYAALLVAAAFGMTWAPQRGWHLFGLSLLAYAAGLFLLLHVKSRYLAPFLPLLLFYAFFAVVAWREPAAGGALRRHWLGWLLGGILAAVLLGLSLAGPLLDR